MRPQPVHLLVTALFSLCLACGTDDQPPTIDGGDQPTEATSPPATPPNQPTPETSRPKATRSAKPTPEQPGPGKVILISVDGLNPDALTSSTPGFSTLLAEGAHTLNARTTAEQTHTLPNHASMLTGRPVLGASGTQVTFNTDPGGTLETTSGGYIPGVFDVAHDHGMRTALLAEKTKFAFLARSWDAEHGAPDRVGRDDGRAKIDTVRIAPADQLLPPLLDSLTSPSSPHLTFLHLAAPDSAGHDDGFMSPEYLSAVRQAGTTIDQVLTTIRDDPRARRSTTVVVTSDHGGRGDDGHGDNTSSANYRVPFFVWRAGQAPADLYALNRSRRDPGTRQLGYAGPQPIRNFDAAELVLSLLALPHLGTAAPPLRAK